MKKKILATLIFTLSSFNTNLYALSFAQTTLFLKGTEVAPKSIAETKKSLDTLSQENLNDLLREFVKGSRPNRFVGSVGHSKSRQFLIDAIKSSDPDNSGMLVVDDFKPDVAWAQKLYRDDFEREVVPNFKPSDPKYKIWKDFTDHMVSEFDQLKSFTGKNIIWEKKGLSKADEIIIVDAHYDTIAHDKKTLRLKTDVEMPGADDNGSGVTIALAMIKVLARMQLPKTVRIVFFDMEEMGFLGSRAYVEKYRTELKQKKFMGLINLEMLGNDTVTGDTKKKSGNMRAYIRKDQEKGHADDAKLVNLINNKGSKFTQVTSFEVVSNSFNQSDHIHFWEAGLPAVTYSENWEDDFNRERYHTSNDFPEAINFKTLHGSYQFIFGGLLSWCFDIP